MGATGQPTELVFGVFMRYLFETPKTIWKESERTEFQQSAGGGSRAWGYKSVLIFCQFVLSRFEMLQCEKINEVQLYVWKCE